jgi:hypothetical protein
MIMTTIRRTTYARSGCSHTPDVASDPPARDSAAARKKVGVSRNLSPEPGLRIIEQHDQARERVFRISFRHPCPVAGNAGDDVEVLGPSGLDATGSDFPL